MNQILQNSIKKSNKKIYLIEFIFSVSLFLIVFIYIIYKKIILTNSQKISDITSRSSSILRLYSTNSIYQPISINPNAYVIGFIEIPKLGIKYPVLSDYSDELLKISVCKFYGPEINHIGNFCILGHNYNTDDFFSNLDKLSRNDVIRIYDNNNNYINYSIFDIYEVEPDNLSYLNASFINLKEITLITCNNINREKNYCKSKRSRLKSAPLFLNTNHCILLLFYKHILLKLQI